MKRVTVKKEVGSKVKCKDCNEIFHTTEPHHNTAKCKVTAISEYKRVKNKGK